MKNTPSIFRFGALTCALAVLTGCGSQTALENPSVAIAAAPPVAPAATPKQAVATHKGMVWIPAGTFAMGGPAMGSLTCSLPKAGSGKPVCAGLMDGFPDAQPNHQVSVDGFWMDATEVTNAQYAAFVRATGYITVAERKPDPAQFPGVDPANLVPGALVFTPPHSAVPLDNYAAWWRYVPGACWNHPSGPNSTIVGKEKFPVVQVAYPDAEAYAQWAGKRLPTEAEWERAARGGREGEPYVWGNTLTPGGRWQCNAFQGDFPYRNTAKDGFAGLAPVAHYAPNHYGLYDMAGNVWEWCHDWYRADYYAQLAPHGMTHNPTGPADSDDPEAPGVPERVQRGGSFLCSDQYCARYLLGTRGRGDPDTGSSHVGFRCVSDH
ncbi:MAG: formylglycine-generating enzyme family protein [Armatimonadota bacterium]|nr:formylglycine-generating enzyme family protein [Armatimonadota bacterium]